MNTYYCKYLRNKLKYDDNAFDFNKNTKFFVFPYYLEIIEKLLEKFIKLKFIRNLITFQVETNNHPKK